MLLEQEVLRASFLLMGFASSGCVILIPTQADVDQREARCCFVLAAGMWDVSKGIEEKSHWNCYILVDHDT